MPSSRFIFWVLIVVVAIAGINQGMTIPLLAVLLEQQGVSSMANGLNAAALYIGIFLVSPFMEWPLRRLGYRTTIICGMGLVMVTTMLVPFFSSLAVWFFLRMLMGIGDTSLHYASQMWVTQIASSVTRGRDISLYGLAYGIGFSIGPLGLKLLHFGTWVPFAVLCVTCLLALLLLLRVENAFPEAVKESKNKENKYAAVIRIGWLALIPSFLYGFMEASLNGSFPVFALRTGISVDWVSNILPAFVVGSILLQMPLGALSDRIGRKKVMMVCAVVGSAAFCLFPLVGDTIWLMMLLLAIAGAAVGSFYSLGLAFAADILPLGMVPTAGIVAGMNFSVASILAPNVNGYILDHLHPGLMFVLMGVLIALFAVSGLFFREKAAKEKGEITEVA